MTGCMSPVILSGSRRNFIFFSANNLPNHADQIRINFAELIIGN